MLPRLLIIDDDPLFHEDIALLLGYCARPAFSAERLDRWDGETWVYRLKRPLDCGEISIVLSPLELLSRLAALVPAAWHPLLRGALGRREAPRTGG